VDCGTETPRDEMYGPPDELRCRACVQRRFPTTNAPVVRRSTVFLRWPPVTTSVVALAVVVTLLAWGHVPLVTDWLFADPAPIWEGQLWRLVTSVFPHLHILHLVFNLLWMWQLGKATERWMGALRFGGFFVAAAAGPLAAQVLVGGTGAGLSGVVYALFGYLYALRDDEDFAAELMGPGVVRTFVAWFFICMLLTYMNWLPVANTAHGAGAVIGWLYGRATLARWRLPALAVVSLLCVGLSMLSLYMPWDRHYCWFRVRQSLAQGNLAAAESWLERAQGPETLLERWNHLLDPRRHGQGG
jgi:membrane associated rhomboid family serine protease